MSTDMGTDTLTMSEKVDVTSEQIDTMMKSMIHYSVVALIFFSIAWSCLTVGVFIINPLSPVGIFFFCASFPCVAISIFYFARYALISKKIKKAAHS